MTPTIKIINPKPYYLYFNFRDWFEFKFPFIITLLIGKNDIEVEVTKGLYEIYKVEFLIDGNLKLQYSKIFEFGIFVIGYCNLFGIWRLNFGI